MAVLLAFNNRLGFRAFCTWCTVGEYIDISLNFLLADWVCGHRSIELSANNRPNEAPRS